jgi:hypothetical protein
VILSAKKDIPEIRHQELFYGSISISVIPKGSLSAFANGFAQVKIFNVIPLPPFSAAMNSAPKHPSLLLYPLFLCLPTTRIPWQSRAQYSIAV